MGVKRWIGGMVCAGTVAAVVGGVLSGAGAAGTRALPDLVPLPPERVVGPWTTLSNPFPGVDVPVVVEGCYADERVRKRAQRCLRYDGIVGNVGEGAFELAYVRRVAGIAAIQRVYNVDGSYADRYAIDSEFHATHAHFHVRDFYVARLWKAAEDGRPSGDEPVARGDKNGFCPQDSEPIAGGSEEDSRYTCLVDWPDGTRALQVVGISPYWKDVYPADLPDQFVEITGVPDGRYVLELEIDPNDVFVETDDGNNTVCTLLELTGTAAEILEPEVAC